MMEPAIRDDILPFNRGLEASLPLRRHSASGNPGRSPNAKASVPSRW